MRNKNLVKFLSPVPNIPVSESKRKKSLTIYFSGVRIISPQSNNNNKVKDNLLTLITRK